MDEKRNVMLVVDNSTTNKHRELLIQIGHALADLWDRVFRFGKKDFNDMLVMFKKKIMSNQTYYELTQAIGMYYQTPKRFGQRKLMLDMTDPILIPLFQVLDELPASHRGRVFEKMRGHFEYEKNRRKFARIEAKMDQEMETSEPDLADDGSLA